MQRVTHVAGPSVFAFFTPNALGLFVDPENPSIKIPRLGLISAPFTGAPRIMKLPEQYLGGKDQKLEVEVFPTLSLSPDGRWAAIPFVPKGQAAHLVLQPTAGGAAQRFQIPVPPTTGVKKPAAAAPRKPAAKKPAPRRR
jgi:hypothetical protein